jgi:hypothetical protein
MENLSRHQSLSQFIIIIIIQCVGMDVDLPTQKERWRTKSQTFWAKIKRIAKLERNAEQKFRTSSLLCGLFVFELRAVNVLVLANYSVKHFIFTSLD